LPHKNEFVINKKEMTYYHCLSPQVINGETIPLTLLLLSSCSRLP